MKRSTATHIRRDLHMMLALLLTALLLGSCSGESLPWDYGSMVSVDIKCDWAKATGVHPAGIEVVFYPSRQDGFIWHFELAGADGGVVEVPSGYYTVAVVNNDLQGVALSTGASAQEYKALTRPVPYAQNGMVRNTGMFCGSVIGDVFIDPCRMEGHSEGRCCNGGVRGSLTCLPDSLATLIDVVLEADGLHGGWVRQFNATVGGLGSILAIASGQSSGHKVMATTTLLNVAEDVWSGSLTGFISQSQLQGLWLEITAIGADGLAYSHRFEPGTYTVNSLSPHHVILTAGEVVIPPVPPLPPSHGEIEAGVEIDGWTPVEIHGTITLP